MKQMLSTCFPNSVRDLCDHQFIPQSEQEFSKDFLNNSEGKENLFKLELMNNTYNNSFNNKYNTYQSYQGIQPYQIINDQNISLSINKNNEEEEESKNSSNWFIVSHSIIDNDLIRTNRKMILEELESNEILNKEKLIINAVGLVNGARKANDGFAFFGSSLQNV